MWFINLGMVLQSLKPSAGDLYRELEYVTCGLIREVVIL